MNQAGSLAEEAAKLLGAVEDWWRDRTGHDAGAAKGPGGRPGGPFAGHDGEAHRSECQACPLCQLLAAFRTARPETFEHALDAAGSLLLAVRSLIEAQDRAGAQGHRPPVQHITIRGGDT